jgi:uncharacterized protein (TIGR02246 family)
MSRKLSRAALALLAIVTATACEDEPLSPGAGWSEAEDVVLEAKVQGSPRDREGIQDIVRTFDEAWTAGDPVRYAAQYAGVADWVGPNGAVLTDPAAITDLYTALFIFVFPNTTRQSTIRNLTFLTGTIAVLDIDTRVTGFGSLPPGIVPWQPGILRALEKNILVKRGGEWRIVRHQQTLVAPGA